MLGRLPQFIDNAPIGTGDGTTVKFYFNTRYLIDGNGDGIIDGDDVTIYSDDTSVAIDHINAEKGYVVLGTAPQSETAITADFFKSDLPDWEIEEEIKNFSKLIEDKTGNTFAYDGLYTQIWDGSGEEKDFFFDRYPVYEIVSYDIDGDTSLVEDTDYYLYPKSDKALYITFETPPLKDNKNVSITYRYGESNEKVNRWVRLNVVSNMFRFIAMKSGNTGIYVSPQNTSPIITPDRAVSLRNQLREEIRELELQLSGMIRVEILDA